MNAKRHTVSSQRIVTTDNPEIAPLWTGPAMVDGEPESVSLAGGWVATMRPRRVRAVLGAELTLALELRPTISGSGEPVLLTKGRMAAWTGRGWRSSVPAARLDRGR